MLIVKKKKKDNLGVESQGSEASFLYVSFLTKYFEIWAHLYLRWAAALELGIVFLIFKFLWTSLGKRVFWFTTSQVSMDNVYTLYKEEIVVKLKQTNTQ